MEIKNRYFSAEVIPARDFNEGGLKFFGEVVYEDWRQERATAQEGFDGELYWKRTTPLVELTPQQERLLRPTDIKKPIT